MRRWCVVGVSLMRVRELQAAAAAGVFLFRPTDRTRGSFLDFLAIFVALEMYSVFYGYLFQVQLFDMWRDHWGHWHGD